MQEGRNAAEGDDALPLRDLSDRIIGAAIEVHRRLGPGFLESIYENALAIELTKGGIKFERQKVLRLTYDGQPIGEHRLDMLAEAVMVIELKAVKAFEDIHFATTRSYLHALSLDHGLLLNFNATTLEIKRVLAHRSRRQTP